MFNSKLLLAAGGGDPVNGVIGPVYDYHGFKLQRHISDEATVITYKAADGTTKRMAVKDAKFRSVQKFGTYQYNVPDLTDFTTLGKYLGKNDARYVVGTTAIPDKQPMPDTVTNDAIFTQWSDAFKADKTSKANCDIWMSCSNRTDSKSIKGVPPVAWCRAQTLAGNPCDLGNEYQIMIIWACGDKLDEMDKTASAYPGLMLGYTASNDVAYGRCQAYNDLRTRQLYSSTEYDRNYVWYVNWSGYCYGGFKYNTGTAVPILELVS